jgi:hypothetical protein
MEFNQIHYSIKVRLVVVLLFVILSVGCMAAIAQDNGVWVLTDGPTSRALSTTPDRGTWTFIGPKVSGNSITSRWDFTGATCPDGRPGYVADTATWTKPPTVLTPGTKLNTTLTLSVQQQPSCSALGDVVHTGVYVGNPAGPSGGVDGWVNLGWSLNDGTPQPVSKVISWDVPSGTIGDVIGYAIFYQGQGGSVNVQYNYTYQAQATPVVTNPVVTNPPTVDNSPVVNNPPVMSSSPVVDSTPFVPPVDSTPVVDNTNAPWIESRTEYIQDDVTKSPGVLILLSAWKHGTPTDVLVPNVPIYINICRKGSMVSNLDQTVTTGTNGYVFFKWLFTENNAEWHIYFSPDSSDRYATGSTSTSVDSYNIPDVSFIPESEIRNAFPGYSDSAGSVGM